MSRTPVMPYATSRGRTFVPSSYPPMWTCISHMPGIRYLPRPSTIVAPVGIRSRPLRAIAAIRSPSTMTVTSRGLAPVPSMSVTFVTAIAFDWAATKMAHAIARDTTIRSRATRGAIPTRTLLVRFTVQLTISTGRTFLRIQCVGLELSRDRTADASTLTARDLRVRFWSER
jgi:hypothetical protein